MSMPDASDPTVSTPGELDIIVARGGLDERLVGLETVFGDELLYMSIWVEYITSGAAEFPAASKYLYGQYFESAWALQGQDLHVVEDAYSALCDTWQLADDGSQEFQSGMSKALEDWAGDAALACSSHVGAMVDFINNECDAVEQLARTLVGYAGVIQGARDNLRALMDGFNQACNAKYEEEDTTWIEFAITAVAAIAGAAFTIATAGTGAAAMAAFGTAMTTIAAEGANAAISSSVGGEEWTDIADSYMTQSEKIVEEAMWAIERKILPAFRHALGHLPQPPQTPTGVTDKGSFHPEDWTGSNVKSAKAQPSGITKRLDS